MNKQSSVGEVESRFFTFAENADQPFKLEKGDALSPVTVAYETYGNLSPERDNAILLFHALSGSQHAAGVNPAVPGVGDLWTDECHVGWWDGFIGPGRALDTDHFYVICANYIGGCSGSTGPRTINTATGKVYGGSFPRITFNDIVDSQIRLLDHLGIDKLHATIGGSLGGMLGINLATRYPERVKIVIPVAAGIEVTILQRIQNFEQIFAIEEDPYFNSGNYYDGPLPDKGLALARMIAHKTYVSLDTMKRRARREVIQREDNLHKYTITHPVESYLLHQGQKFVRRFDANTYIRIMDAWQHSDLARAAGVDTPKEAFERCKEQRFMVFSIDSDVSFYPDEQAELVHLLKQCDVPVQHITVHSENGHDSFLLEPDLFTPHLTYTLRERW
ncbi:MAG: homoserine O-acetyltransferase [Verrucomicrobia bacterium]|nr:homoserine O-acetyltransferase [Verrucomicrobiota bacterium]